MKIKTIIHEAEEGGFGAEVPSMLIRLAHTRRPSLCLEPDAHVRSSANDGALSACQSESKSHSSSAFG
ncbi:hypothetical protein, partial [Desulfobacterium sp. N47]|uniref:hypothetical protein n=1 Tax=Desulfobacterium sp. N47 TaxID=3115210 RepID=UPI003F49BC86